MMRKPKLEPQVALQHLPCSSVRSVPPGCWEHVIFLLNSFTIPPTAFLMKSKCLFNMPLRRHSGPVYTGCLGEVVCFLCPKGTPFTSGSPGPPCVDETVALESGRPESNGSSTISLACNPGPVSKPCLSFLICKRGIIIEMPISHG